MVPAAPSPSPTVTSSVGPSQRRAPSSRLVLAVGVPSPCVAMTWGRRHGGLRARGRDGRRHRGGSRRRPRAARARGKHAEDYQGRPAPHDRVHTFRVGGRPGRAITSAARACRAPRSRPDVVERDETLGRSAARSPSGMQWDGRRRPLTGVAAGQGPFGLMWRLMDSNQRRHRRRLYRSARGRYWACQDEPAGNGLDARTTQGDLPAAHPRPQSSYGTDPGRKP
jgi:hypothetical protein